MVVQRSVLAMGSDSEEADGEVSCVRDKAKTGIDGQVSDLFLSLNGR